MKRILKALLHALVPAMLVLMAGSAQATTYNSSGTVSTWYRNHEGLHIPEVLGCSGGALCSAISTKYATASVEGVMSPGSISVDIVASGSGDGWGEVSYRGFFGDSYTVQSDTLAPGTLVNVRYSVDFDIPTSGGAGIMPQFTVSFGPFPDCCHAVFRTWDSRSPGVPGDLYGVLQVPVGVEQPITGQLVANIGQAYRVPGTALAAGSVNFYLEVLDPGATLSSASGFGYRMAAPVPEPGTWAMLLAGGALLAGVSRRRSQPAVPRHTQP